MKIILLEELEGLGVKDDIVVVKDGYARNYLIPRGKAVEATPESIKKWEYRKKLSEFKRNREEEEAKRLKEKLEALSLTAVVKAGEDERLFGAVTSHTIEELLHHERLEIDRKKIILQEPIKQLGVYTIPIRLTHDVEAQIKLWVVKE
jgi:large subunit ribosomal protein L9